VLALVGTVLVGLRGLADVDAANRQVFSDNLLTVVRNDIASLESIHAGDPPAERTQITRIPALWAVYPATAHRGLLAGVFARALRIPSCCRHR
jgi:hypothetical protein